MKVRAFEVLGPGFRTVMLAVPCAAMSVAGMVAVSCALLTNVVVRLDPFHVTVDPETKFDPFTVRVKPCPPATMELGLRLVRPGTEAPTVRLYTLLTVEAWG